MAQERPFDIVGTWQLVHTRAWDDSGQAMPAPYGPEPRGIVRFETNGRMMCVLADGRAGLGPREYNSYMGSYTFDGATLVTKVDGATDLARLGSDQVRKVRTDGPRLILTPPARPKGAVTENRELTWERVGG